MTQEFFVKNIRETNKLAKILAQEIKKKPLKNKSALIIGLQGELGSGKTTFVKAFAKGLDIRKRITSPSFVLIKSYKLQATGYLYHIDCYRIKSYKDILALDFQEIISSPKNIVLIEWAEKISKLLPEDTIWINFKIESEKQRRVIISNSPNF